MPERASEPLFKCPDCRGEGITGEQVYEHLNHEGGIWHDVICFTCDGLGRLDRA
jgi:hypothetical protein